MTVQAIPQLEGAQVVSASMDDSGSPPDFPDAIGFRLALSLSDGRVVEMWTCSCCGLNVYEDGVAVDVYGDA